MLERIDTKEIMTVYEAAKKYPTKYICMVITEIVNDGDDDLGYVIYTADSHREIHTLPKDSHKNKMVEFLPGYSAEPQQVGGYQVEWAS